MNSDAPAYWLWLLAAVSAGIFILFAFSFFKPRTARLADSECFLRLFSWRFFPKCTAFPSSVPATLEPPYKTQNTVTNQSPYLSI